MKKVMKKVPFIVAGIFWAWVGISLFEIIANNLNPEYIYHNWNIFVLMLGL